MPCIHCGVEERDYCESCGSGAIEVCEAIVDAWKGAGGDPGADPQTAANFVMACGLIVDQATRVLGARVGVVDGVCTTCECETDGSDHCPACDPVGYLRDRMEGLCDAVDQFIAEGCDGRDLDDWIASARLSIRNTSQE
jgi:hypothetical protein